MLERNHFVLDMYLMRAEDRVIHIVDHLAVHAEDSLIHIVVVEAVEVRIAGCFVDTPDIAD